MKVDQRSNVSDAPTSDRTTSGRVPDFMLIGAMRAGTTTLHAYLCRHHQVFMAKPKEPQFFSRDHVYERGIEWYKSILADASPEQVCGEASTCYSRCPPYQKAAARIAEHAPHAKFIYIMRHPVERLYSHYGHTMQERWSKDPSCGVVSLEEFVETDVEAVSASLYIRQIERYLQFFPRSRFLFLTLDDLREDPSDVLREVQRFLDLEKAELVEDIPVVANRTGDLLARVRVRNVLRSLRSTRSASLIAKAVPRSWRPQARGTIIECANSFLAGRMRRQFRNELSPLLPERRARLLEIFKTPTEELEAFLGRNLSSWYR